jgi:hypothetical protein
LRTPCGNHEAPGGSGGCPPPQPGIASWLAILFAAGCNEGRSGPSDTADALDEGTVEAAPDDAADEDAGADTEADAFWQGTWCGEGPAVCLAPQVCCYPPGVPNEWDFGTAECRARADCPADHTKECDGDEDCPEGQACCSTDPVYPVTACQAGPCAARLCHAYGAEDECPGGQSCCGDMRFPDNMLYLCTVTDGGSCPDG